MINILSYTIGFALTIITSFFIGVFYFKYIIRKNAITNLHYVAIGEKLLVGITLLTASIAIIKTNGITTQSIILILLLLPRILLKKQNNIDTDQVKTKSNKLLLISIACFVFFFHYFGFYHLHDHVFYAKLGKAIFSNGNESWSALYDNFKAAKGIMLYHYSDMWLGEFISEIFFKNSLFCLTKIIYPTYHFIMFIICFGIINETAKNANQAISIIIGPVMTYLTIEAFKNLKNIVLPSIVISIFAILNLISINSFNYGDNKLENFEKKLLNFSSIELNNKNWCYYSEYPWSTWMYSSQISNSPILLENDTYLGLEIAPFFNSSFETYKKNNPNSPICSINQNICDLSKLLKSLNIEYVYIENINTINKEFKLYLKPILIQNQKGIFKFNNNQFLNNPM